MLHSPAQRCLDIIEVLSEVPDGLALSALGERLSLPKSAAHRFLALLATRGYVRQDPASQRYALTLRLPALAFRYLAGTRIADVCQPILDALAARTGELARLAVVEGESLTWVAKAQGASSGLRYDAEAGRDVVLRATATGKAWLATLPEDAALAIVQRAWAQGPAPTGPRAPRTLDAFRAQLRATRRRGYGEAVEEGEPGVAAVAAAIRRDPAVGAPVVATVSVAGPVARIDAARRAVLGREVVTAARELTEVWPVRQHLAGPSPEGDVARAA